MRILLVNDTSCQSNWGCRATTYQLKRLLNTSRSTVFRSISIKELSQPVAPRWLPSRLTRFAPDAVPPRLADFDRYAQRLLAGKLHLRAGDGAPLDLRAVLSEADLIYINGEGSLHGDRRIVRAIFFIAYAARRYLDKPCVLMNHTIDMQHPHVRQMAERVYPLLSDVAFREQISQEACRPLTRHLPDSTLIPDAAFLWEPASLGDLLPVTHRPEYYSTWPDSAAGFDPGRPYICIGASSIYYRAESRGCDPIPGFLRLCEALHTTVAPVVLTAPCKNDEHIFRAIARRLHLPLIGQNTPTQQAVDILAHARLYISGRWHPSIFAVRGGTPIVTLTANTFKLNALNRLMEMNTPTFDALKLEEHCDEMVALARRLVEDNDRLRPAIRERARRLAMTATQNGRCVARFGAAARAA